MSLKKWTVAKVERSDIKSFIEKWHYSKSINGCRSSYHYALYDEQNIMKGAMFYGGMAMANQWKKFATKEDDVLELRRLCCVDDTPKNTESFFIGATIRDLKKNWQGKILVSYADKEYGHTGTIYKASNWEMIGETKGAKVIIFNGRRYHDKTIRTKYKGKLKPYAQKIKTALDNGNAYYKTTKGKYTYTYTINL
jgi:hypothetical protein